MNQDKEAPKIEKKPKIPDLPPPPRTEKEIKKGTYDPKESVKIQKVNRTGGS